MIHERQFIDDLENNIIIITKNIKILMIKILHIECKKLILLLVLDIKY